MLLLIDGAMSVPEDIATEEEIFGGSYRKEMMFPLIRLPKVRKKYAVAAGLLGLGILIALARRYLKKK